MIENSFIFLERVGKTLEKKFWGLGINNWKDFLEAESVPGISNNRKRYYDRQIESARHALNTHDSAHFTKILPKSEAWRLFDYFKDQTVYLDIETSGYYGDVTVIGLFDGFRTMTMIKGINLDPQQLKKHLKKYKLLVSFNGLAFDAVVLERFYPGIMPKIPHFDLCFACRRLGLTGGLKVVERTLGIRRQDPVSDMRGQDAIYLWQAYKSTRNKKYLDKLVMYNEEDIINLLPIANHVVKELKKSL